MNSINAAQDVAGLLPRIGEDNQTTQKEATWSCSQGISEDSLWFSRGCAVTVRRGRQAETGFLGILLPAVRAPPSIQANTVKQRHPYINRSVVSQ